MDCKWESSHGTFKRDGRSRTRRRRRASIWAELSTVFRNAESPAGAAPMAPLIQPKVSLGYTYRRRAGPLSTSHPMTGVMVAPLVAEAAHRVTEAAPKQLNSIPNQVRSNWNGCRVDDPASQPSPLNPCMRPGTSMVGSAHPSCLFCRCDFLPRSCIGRRRISCCFPCPCVC